MVERGKFIVFEGIDGSGKTTLSKMLAEDIIKEGKYVEWTCEPTHNVIGKIIRSVLTHQLEMNEQSIAALYLADRMDHIQNHEYGMLGQLESGLHVISDRYYLSSYAYHVPHVSLDWVMEANSLAANILRPDVIFYIDIDVATSMDRISKFRTQQDLFENEERITLVHNNYHNALEKIKDKENIVIIDGRLPLGEVYQNLKAEVSKIGL